MCRTQICPSDLRHSERYQRLVKQKRRQSIFFQLKGPTNNFSLTCSLLSILSKFGHSHLLNHPLDPFIFVPYKLNPFLLVTGLLFFSPVYLLSDLFVLLKNTEKISNVRRSSIFREWFQLTFEASICSSHAVKSGSKFFFFFFTLSG